MHDERLVSLAEEVSFVESHSCLTIYDTFSGVTVQGALRRNAIEISEDNLLQLKYDPESVYGYVEVYNQIKRVSRVYHW